MTDDPLSDLKAYFGEYVPRALSTRQDLVGLLGDISMVAQLDVEGDEGGLWHFVIEYGTVRVSSGRHPKPTFTVSASVTTLRRLRSRELAPISAFMSGKLRVTGNVVAAMKLAGLFKG